MKRNYPAFLCVIFFTGLLNAQTDNSQKPRLMADSLVRHFNRAEFKKIYALTSPGFQSGISEKEALGLLELNLYKDLGVIKGADYLKEDKGLYSFVLSFDAAKIEMKLGLDKQSKIDFLQFLPYHAVPFGKRTVYASDNKKQNGLDSLIEETLAAYMQSPENCGISIAISKGGKRYFYNYGETRRNDNKLPNQTTIYEIGSITKTFCGLLLAKAIIEKKIDPESDIRQYLPGNYPNLVFKGAPILVKHLANHTSGLPGIPENLETQPGYDSLNPYRYYSRKMLYDYLKTITPLAEPGRVCAYSNVGMALAGLLLETVYNKPFESLLREKITGPLSMRNTAVHLSAEQERNFAQGYNQAGISTPAWELGDFVAAGGIRSDAEDMLAYMEYHLAEQDTAARLSHRITYSGHEKVGLAWFISQTRQGHTLVWHNGGTFGFSSFCGFIRDKACSVVVLSNAGTNVDFIGIALLNYLQK